MMMLLLWFLDMGLLTVAGRLLRVVCCVSFNLCRALMVVRVLFLFVVAGGGDGRCGGGDDDDDVDDGLMMAWFVSFGWLFDLILVVVVMAGALLVLTVMIVMAMMVSVMLCHCAMDQDYCREYAQDTTGNLDALPFL